jgi:archaellum biogenesis ATPase FlaH
MIDIRNVIVNKLKTIHPRVYFLKSSSTASFPYLVYDVNITNLEDGLQLVTLDVDGWDNVSDTTALEQLMDKVKDTLNTQTVIVDKLAVTFYLDRMTTLVDDDPTLNRRKYIFEGRLYER